MVNVKSILITIASLATVSVLGIFILLYKLTKVAAKHFCNSNN